MSKAILIIGATGAGKTVFTKETIKPVNKNALEIFDVNGEYTQYYTGKFNPNMEKFLGRIYNNETDEHKITKAVIVMEDATSFFSNRGCDSTLTKMLVAKRHSQNTYLLLFHSMQDIPKYIVRKCTHMALFRTLDDPKYVKSNFDYSGIYNAWQEVQNKTKTNPFYECYPPPKGTKPDYKLISLY